VAGGREGTGGGIVGAEPDPGGVTGPVWLEPGSDARAPQSGHRPPEGMAALRQDGQVMLFDRLSVRDDAGIILRTLPAGNGRRRRETAGLAC